MFTKRHKWDNSPLQFRNTPIPFKKSVKYLGVHLNYRLSWLEHIEAKCRSASLALMACRRAVGKSWGLTPKTCRWIYTAIIRPIITYASCVWSCNLGPGQIKRLTKIQRLACIFCTSAFHTSPTAALERILCLSPLDLHTQHTALNQMQGLKLAKIWRSPKPNCPSKAHHKALKTTAKSIPSLAMPSEGLETVTTPRRFNIEILDCKTATEEVHKRKSHICVFTDGSKTKQGTGLGYTILQPGEDPLCKKVTLCNMASINQAEMLAINLAGIELFNLDPGSNAISFFSDSLVCLKSLTKSRVTNLTTECFQTLNKLARHRSVTLLWVPGHKGIEGNETADKLAREGSSEDFIGPLPSIPVSSTLHKLSTYKFIEKACNHRWNNLPTCRQARHNLVSMPRRALNELLNLPRLQVRHLTTILTGHGNIGHHLCKMGITDSTKCPFCGCDDEDSAHFMAICPRFAGTRLSRLGLTTDPDHRWRRMPYGKISRYIEETGRIKVIVDNTTSHSPTRNDSNSNSDES